MSKNKEASDEKFLRNNYLVNYVRDVYQSDPVVGQELMALNNSFMEDMMKKAGVGDFNKKKG